MLGGLIALGLIGAGVMGGRAALAVKTLERTVVVKGLSEREMPADTVIWPISFQLAGNDLSGLYDNIASQSEVVLGFLAENGVAAADMSRGAPLVTDLHAQQYGDKSQIRFRYTAQATVTVYSRNIAAVRQAMVRLVDLGKRGVVVGSTGYGSASTEFLFTGLSTLKPDMIEEATRNARAVAEKFADDSDSDLGKIRKASQGQFSISDRDASTPHIKTVRVVSTVEYYLSD
ncbi:MAG: SIMPL domain-containing protein [Oceanococcaceae bacterium]